MHGHGLWGASDLFGVGGLGVNMRELKFRQKLQNGTFHYWGFPTDKPGCFIAPASDGSDGLSKAQENSDQFTGLKDKNLKEIYGADVVRIVDENYQVVFHFNRWMAKRRGKAYEIRKIDVGSFYQVIGNVWDNPELLKT